MTRETIWTRVRESLYVRCIMDEREPSLGRYKIESPGREERVR